MSHLIKFLKEAHSRSLVSGHGISPSFNKRIVIIDDSPEMMDFTADEFGDVEDEKVLLETKLIEDELMDNLAEALVRRGGREELDHIVTMLVRKAETNMKERATELLK